MMTFSTLPNRKLMMRNELRMTRTRTKPVFHNWLPGFLLSYCFYYTNSNEAFFDFKVLEKINEHGYNAVND